ncbi:MAG TPA: hypothetical protein VFT59_04985 [Candidatus Saccharimonadales bacterium]|nr:hypothetical protein [Candidatus Saccharimonadales bacterium]
MALRTPDTKNEQDAAHNPSQEYYDSEFNNIVSAHKTAEELQNQEKMAGNINAIERYANDPQNASQNIDKTKEQEQSGDWRTKVEGQKKPKEKLQARLKNAMKKKGPIGVIAALLLGGGAGLGFFGFTLMPMTIAEHFTNDTNDLHPSSQRKVINVFGKKLGGQDFQKRMSACNSVVSIRCKFNTLKPDLVERFEKEGFKFHDKTEVNGRVAFTALEFPDGTIVHTAAELSALLSNSAVAAAAFNAVYSLKNALFVIGGWFKGVLAKLNLTKGKKIEGETRKETDKAYEDSVKGEKGTVSTNAVAADDPGENASEEQRNAAQQATDAGNETSRQINEAISKGQKLKSLSLKATNALAVPQMICLTYNMAGFIATTAKIKKALYFAGFAMIFLTLASSIKANAATNAEVETAMNVLAPSKYPAQVEDPETGETIDNPDIGETALDAEAYKVVAYGDQINLTGIAMRFFVAGGFLGILQRIVTWADQTLGKNNIKTGCKIVNSTVAQVIAFLAAPVLTGAFMLATTILPIEEWAAELVNIAIDAAAGIDPTTELIGSDAGNAMFVGTAMIMGTAAMKFGMKPGTVDAVRKNMADNHELLQKEIAMKTYEASKTPLDVTNRYSFLGSMAYQIAHFMPNFQQPVLAGAGKVFSAVPGSLNMLTKNASAAYSMPVADYSDVRFSQCKDEVYTELKDRFTPDMFCAIRYVPNEYQDSEAVLDYMESRGEIDPVSGAAKPGSYLEKYMKYCVEREDPWGSTSIAAEEMTDDPNWYTGVKCTDVTTENTMSSEYVGYKTVQSVIDREDPEAAPTDTQVTSGDSRELARQVANNPDIELGANTKADLLRFADTGQAVNSCNANFTLDSGMLGAMQTLSGKYRILVNNIGFNDDRDRCDNGQHPKGAAVDINGIEVKGGAKTNWGSIRFTPQEMPIITSYANDWLVALAPGRGGVGQKGCLNGSRVASGGFSVTPPPGATGINGNLNFVDDCTHLHIDARVR